jgi:hypothetical protein
MRFELKGGQSKREQFFAEISEKPATVGILIQSHQLWEEKLPTELTA